MIDTILWIIVIIMLVFDDERLNLIGVGVGIIASIFLFIIGVKAWPLTLMTIAFYWLLSFLVATLTRWIIKKVHNS